MMSLTPPTTRKSPFLLLAILAVVAGCSTPVPITVTPEEVFSPPVDTEVKLEVGDTVQVGLFKSYSADVPYHFQVGDQLKVMVANRPELTEEITVLPDGTAVFPLLGVIPVRGKTVTEVRDELNKLYGNAVKTPAVDLLVVKAQAAIEDFFTTLKDSGAGPVRNITLSEHGSIDLPLIPPVKALGRTIEEAREEIQSAYASALPGVRVTFSLASRPERSIAVLGEVRNPGSIAYSTGTSLMRALALAGGVSDRAWLAQVIVARSQADGGVKVDVVDLSGTFDGIDAKGYAHRLAPNTIVYVPMSPIAEVDIFVDQYIRQLLPIRPAFGIGVGWDLSQ